MGVSETKFACGYVLRFTDGGPPESQVLHIGTLEECQNVADMIPAVSYSGDRPLKDCHMRVVEWPDESQPSEPQP